MINPRKLAAIDVVFLGPTLIIAEFAGAILLCVALGAFILWRAASYWQFVLGFYFVSLGINYVTMLLYALKFKNRESARAEIGDELNDKQSAIAKYRRQSVYLLVPLVVPLVALCLRPHESEPRR